MTVYVDQLMNTAGMSAKWRYKQSCHMTAYTEEELHAMAAKIGLQRAWFQNHVNLAHQHYDLTASKRAQAIKYDAVSLTLREIAQRMSAVRRQVGHD